MSSTSEPGASFNYHYVIVIHIFLWAVSLTSRLHQGLLQGHRAPATSHGCSVVSCAFLVFLADAELLRPPSAWRRVWHQGSSHKCVLTKCNMKESHLDCMTKGMCV